MWSLSGFRRMAGVVAVAGLVPLGLGASIAGAKEVTRSYDESFTVEPGAILSLDHGDGNVTLTSWDRDEIHVVVRYQADFSRIGWGSDPDFHVDFRQDGDVVRVVGRRGGPGGSGNGIFLMQSSRVKEYEYEIQVPPWIELECRGEDGDVRAEGLAGGTIHWRLEDGDLALRGVRTDDARLRVEDGDVTLTDFDGPLILETEDGDSALLQCHSDRARIVSEDGRVTLRGCSGDFSIRTEDGDVRARDFAVQALEIRTEDGRVELEILPTPSFEMEVDAEDGSVTVHFAQGVSAEYLVSSDDGRIRVDLNATKQEAGRNSAYGILGSGDGRVRIQTQDGSIQLDGEAGSS